GPPLSGRNTKVLSWMPSRIGTMVWKQRAPLAVSVCIGCPPPAVPTPAQSHGTLYDASNASRSRYYRMSPRVRRVGCPRARHHLPATGGDTGRLVGRHVSSTVE